MAQPVQPQNDPNKQVMVEDDDISLDAVTTRVELRENGIAACYLTANNEEGKLYLESLHLNDRVVVKLLPDSNPPTTPIWGAVSSVFDGNIQELAPILNTSGQICQVVAYGKGYQLKEMRVSKQYGLITPVLSWGFTNHFDDTIHEWDSSNGYHRAQPPYINSYSGLGFPLGLAFLGLTHCIYSELDSHLESDIGAFTLGITPEYDGGEFVTAQLHIVGALYSNGAGTADSVNIRAYWTIDDGAHWTAFTPDFDPIDAIIQSNGANDPIWRTYTLLDPYPNTNYNPAINASPPEGNDVYIDISSVIPYWNSDLKIKLEISQIGGSAIGGVSIALMYLEYQFEDTSGKTVRELLVGENGTIGIIPKYVNKILGTTVSSGYDEINTDYVVKDDVDDEDLLIPFIKFPYEDALTSIQDIIKYGSALKFLQNSAGYHWKVDTDGNLLVAPTTNHTVAGIDGAHLVSSKWVLSPYATPIKVKQEMITQDFKESIPLANYVLVAGKYHYPLNDNICRGLGIDLWQTDGGVGMWGTRDVVLIPSDIASNSPCLEFQCVYDTLPAVVKNIYAYPLPIGLDLTQLMGMNTVPTMSFWIKIGGGVTSLALRLYPEDPDNLGHPLFSGFYSILIEGVELINTWVFVEIPLPNTAFQKEYGNWNVATDSIFGLTAPSIDWQYMNNVKFFAIYYNAGSFVGAPYVRMRGFSINGVVIRGA